MTYYLARLVTTKTVAWLAALLFSLETEHIIISSLIRTEPLFMVLWLGAFILFFNYFRTSSRNVLYAALTGLLLGLATLTRPFTQLVPFIFVLFALLPFTRPQSFTFPLRKIALHMSMMVGVFILVLAPWIIRNGILFGSYRLSPIFAYITYKNLALEIESDYLFAQGKSHSEIVTAIFKYYSDSFEKTKQYPNQQINDTKDFLLVLTSFKAESVISSQASALLWSHPWFTLHRIINRQISFFIDSAFAYNINANLKNVVDIPPQIIYPYVFWAGRVWWIMLYGCILFTVIFFPSKYVVQRKGFLTLFLLIILYTSLLSLYPNTRLRYPINPFIFIIAADAFIFLCGHYKNKRLLVT